MTPLSVEFSDSGIFLDEAEQAHLAISLAKDFFNEDVYLRIPRMLKLLIRVISVFSGSAKIEVHAKSAQHGMRAMRVNYYFPVGMNSSRYILDGQSKSVLPHHVLEMMFKRL